MRTNIIAGIMLPLIAGSIAAFFAPAEWRLGPDLPLWDTSVGTATQVIGTATAIVFALLVVPIQNAAVRYSPLFLNHIARDRQLVTVFAWTVFALCYAFAVLTFGITPGRVGGTTALTLSVMPALGWAAFRVMYLLDPIHLAELVEQALVRKLPKAMKRYSQRHAAELAKYQQLTRIRLPVALSQPPTPADLARHLHAVLQSLLSIVGRATESGQVDVVSRVLRSVTNVHKAAMQAWGASATANDYLTAKLTEELFALAQAARHGTSPHVLPKVIEALGTIATNAVGVSTPGVGFGEQNVSGMPIGYLGRIASGTVKDIDSSAPALATEQLGTATYHLLERGLPSSVTGAIDSQFCPLMLLSLQPYSYHVAGRASQWLMRLWGLAGRVDGGDLVQNAIVRCLERYFRAYRGSTHDLTQEAALGPIVLPNFSDPFGSTPAGAAVATSLAAADWPPSDASLKNAWYLGMHLVRELVHPAGSGEWKDDYLAKYAGQQTAEIAVLFAAIASLTFRHPKSDASELSARRRSNDQVQAEAADNWEWLTKDLLSTSSSSTKGADGELPASWTVYRDALTNTTGCILGALVALEKQPTPVLQDRVDRVLDYFCELVQRLLTNQPETMDNHPLVQYLRMIGAWLLALGYEDAARRIAPIIGRAAPYRESWAGGGGYWGRLYPDENAISRWVRPFISTTAQRYFPGYHADHEFMSDEARQALERIIDEYRADQSGKKPGRHARARPPEPQEKS